MPFKCSNRFKIVFDRLRLSFNAATILLLLCKKYAKCKFASRAVCTYAHVSQKRPGCALIGECALNRTNTVYNI